MNVRAWSVSLLLFLSTVTAVGQTVNRYLNTPLPKEWTITGGSLFRTPSWTL